MREATVSAMDRPRAPPSPLQSPRPGHVPSRHLTCVLVSWLTQAPAGGRECRSLLAVCKELCGHMI
jgi:hypothetical protein